MDPKELELVNSILLDGEKLKDHLKLKGVSENALKKLEESVVASVAAVCLIKYQKRLEVLINTYQD